MLCLAFLPSAALGQTVLAQNAPVQPAPVQAPQQGPCGRTPVTPTEQVLYQRILRRFGPAGLTSQQQQQIQQMVGQYSQAHPAGSPVDRPAMKQLRRSIVAMLTPQQQQALEQAREAARQNGGGMHGGGGGCRG
ncbi:MAG TPA: hypothetical protein VMF61_04255 [Candidatus Acidoferrales bacterium]|nr:hypothetical protein [Candidatus Acidoferrales bacterium]